MNSLNRTILVMDDDEDVRFIAEIILNKAGFDVVFAESGQEAIDITKSLYSQGKKFHAAILDLNIPGRMGGKEAVPGLVEVDPDITLYVSCGNPYDPVMEDPEMYGFKGSIPKPFDPESIQILLNNQQT